MGEMYFVGLPKRKYVQKIIYSSSAMTLLLKGKSIDVAISDSLEEKNLNPLQSG